MEVKTCEYPHKFCERPATQPNELAKRGDDRICLCKKHADLSALQWAQNSC